MDRLVSLKKVSFGYDNQKIIEDLSFEIAEGEIIGVSGKNGSGKSTLLNIIGGLITDFQGMIQYGDNLGQIGCMIGGAPIYEDLSVKNNIEMIKRMDGTRNFRFDEALYEITDLKQYEKKRAGKLSLGNKQMLALLLSIGSKSKLLLLDEPFNGIDPIHKAALMKYLKQRAKSGTAIVMTSHIKGDLKLMCDRIIELSYGVDK